MQTKVNGEIVGIGAPKKISGGEITVMEFYLKETNSSYSQTFKINLFNDRISQIDPFKKGDMVEVDIYVTSKPWTNAKGVETLFVGLNGNRINKFNE
jgi:hypothetical protein